MSTTPITAKARRRELRLNVVRDSSNYSVRVGDGRGNQTRSIIGEGQDPKGPCKQPPLAPQVLIVKNPDRTNLATITRRDKYSRAHEKEVVIHEIPKHGSPSALNRSVVGCRVSDNVRSRNKMALHREQVIDTVDEETYFAGKASSPVTNHNYFALCLDQSKNALPELIAYWCEDRASWRISRVGRTVHLPNASVHQFQASRKRPIEAKVNLIVLATMYSQRFRLEQAPYLAVREHFSQGFEHSFRFNEGAAEKILRRPLVERDMHRRFPNCEHKPRPLNHLHRCDDLRDDCGKDLSPILAPFDFLAPIRLIRSTRTPAEAGSRCSNLKPVN